MPRYESGRYESPLSGGPQGGECWEIAQMGRDVSVASEGPLKGWSLARMLSTWGPEILGDDQHMRFSGRFPLLIKFLAAHERLSLQVHPGDDFAERYEIDTAGKMEVWIVLHAPPEGRVIRGVLPGTTIAEFRQHLAAGTIEKCLNVMEVSRGDTIFIPPGTIHSAFGGVVVLEVQQASDITYRLTDWGRTAGAGKSRPLSVEKAMSVTDFYSMGVSKYKPSRIPEYSYTRNLLIKCEKFTLESLETTGKRIQERSDPNRFSVLTVTRGAGSFRYGPKKKQSTAFGLGQTFLIPAHLGEYDISARGTVEMVCAYVQ